MASPFVLTLILATAVLHLAARLFHFKALSLADVSLVSPFAALTPVLTILTGWVILAERPNVVELAGILIVVVSLLGLTEVKRLFQARSDSGKTNVSAQGTAEKAFYVSQYQRTRRDAADTGFLGQTDQPL